MSSPAFGFDEAGKKFALCAWHGLGGGQGGLRLSLSLKSVQRDALPEGDQALRSQLGQLFQRRLDILMLIALDDLALGVGDRGGEQERAVQMEPRIEGFLVEGLSLRLIPGWKYAPRSGSYHIGKGWRLTSLARCEDTLNGIIEFPDPAAGQYRPRPSGRHAAHLAWDQGVTSFDPNH